jgi:glycosyltransferase involved in cell wall biosynthesis
MRPRLERRVGELGLAGRVVFPGWSYEPARYVAGAAVHVVPSREEAWSQSAIVALGLGVPVVGTAVEGLPLTLGDGRGVLAPPEDPPALADQIVRVLRGQARTDLDGSRVFAAKFTPKAVATYYASGYRRVLNAHTVA